MGGKVVWPAAERNSFIHTDTFVSLALTVALIARHNSWKSCMTLSVD